MPDEEFASYVEGLVSIKLKKQSQLGEELKYNWDEISGEYYQFKRSKQKHLNISIYYLPISIIYFIVILIPSFLLFLREIIGRRIEAYYKTRRDRLLSS